MQQKLAEMIVSIGGSASDSVLAQLGFRSCSRSQREYLSRIDRKELTQFVHAIGYEQASERFNYVQLPLYYVHTPLEADAHRFLQSNITNDYSKRPGTRITLLANEEF